MDRQAEQRPARAVSGDEAFPGEVSFHVGGGVTWRSDPAAPFTTAALLGAAFALPLLPWLRLRRDALLARWPGAAPRVAWGVARNAVLLAGLVLAMTSLASGSYNPFIYFRF